MKAHSKGKDYFQRSIAQSIRHYSGTKESTIRPEQQEKSMEIGNYKILLDEVLGKGYSCSVYKGVEKGKGLKRFAIKVIELKHFSSSCMQLFDREIEIHRHLKHDNIVRCYDVFKTKTHYYIVMEYCPHGDLAAHLAQTKRVSEPAIVDIMTQIISGYKYIAKLGILHRDLKPANVLRNGKAWKISDFGFSVRSGSFVDDINVGTPLYMPLESLTRSFYSVKTDIFALGVILYEMVHGSTPWECDSQTELMKKMHDQKMVIRKPISNAKITHFIVRCLEFKECSRMSRQELQSFSFAGGAEHDTSDLQKDLFTQSQSYVVKEASEADFVATNNSIMLSYLNHCSFIYDMIQHIDCFVLPPDQKDAFLMVLLKYLLKLVKTLGNAPSQRLVKFDEYKSKEHYQLLHQQMQQNAAKYEKTYLDHIKHTDVKVIRTVNNKFKEFTVASQPLTAEFYLKLKQYLVSLLKQSNDSLAVLINQPRQEQSLNEKLEAFQTLIVLYRYVDGKAKGQSINFTFQGLSDYTHSKLKKIDFLTLRKQVKLV